MAAKRNVPNKQDISNHYDEHLDEINETVGKLLNAIKTGSNSNAGEFLPKKEKKNGQAKRPSNCNILYSNQIMELGVRKIAENICKKHKYNNQRIMVISRQFTGRIWKEIISDETKKHFENLAKVVNELHKEKYPDYKLVKSKRKNKNITFKPYDTTNKANKPRRAKNSLVKNKAVTLPSEDKDGLPSDQVVMSLPSFPSSPRSGEDSFPSDQVNMSLPSAQIYPDLYSPIPPTMISKIPSPQPFPQYFTNQTSTSFPLPRLNNQSSIQPDHNVQMSNPHFNLNIPTALLTPTYPNPSSEASPPTFNMHPSPSPLCEDQLHNIRKYYEEIFSSKDQPGSSYAYFDN